MDKYLIPPPPKQIQPTPSSGGYVKMHKTFWAIHNANNISDPYTRYIYALIKTKCRWKSWNTMFTTWIPTDYPYMINNWILTSLPPWQRGYVFGSVGLFVCLSVCGQHYSKCSKRIGMKFYGGVLGSTMKN